MATKKDQTPDPAFGKAPEPEDMEVTTQDEQKPPVEVSAEPAPKTVAMVQYHGLSEDEARRVAKIKADFGTLVGYLKSLRDAVHDSEVQRMYSVAITEAETASMWAVRAVTWRG